MSALGVDKPAIVAALRQISELVEASGEGGFRARAYATGARVLERLAPDELEARLREERLTELPGIGDGLAGVVGELWRTGRSTTLDELRARVPAGRVALRGIPELGPKRIEALEAALGVTSREALEAACVAGRVRTVPGFSAKLESRLLEFLRAAPESAGAPELLLHQAVGLAERLVAWLEDGVPDARVEAAGSVRRRVELASELVLIASAPAPHRVLDRLEAFPQVRQVVERDGERGVVRLDEGRAVDLPVTVVAVAPERFVAALHHHTGSPGHLERLARQADARGLRLSAEGLFERGARRPLALRDEPDLYARLGLPFVPPELREAIGEVEAALAGDSFQDLVTREDVRGAVHCHTTWSDGKDGVEAMARAAEALGLEYLTITDHSPTAHYAGGLDLARLERQWADIDEVQARVKVRLLKGTEADITREGALDYPDRVLERLDVVIASVHQRYKLDEDAMTARLVRAMRHPLFKIWGHALGRLLGRRPPIACRVREVLDAAAESRAAIEINGDPYRLDLAPPWVREARARDIPLVLSSDAHSTAGLTAFHWAVDMARRAGVRTAEVLNTRSAAAFAAAVRPG